MRDIGTNEPLVVFPMHDMAVIMNEAVLQKVLSGTTRDEPEKGTPNLVGCQSGVLRRILLKLRLSF